MPAQSRRSSSVDAPERASSESALTLGTFSPLLARQAHTAALFGVRHVCLKPGLLQAPRIDFVVGWGQKETAAPAKEFAQRFDLPYLRAEDGFVRSLGLGVLGDPPCSVVLDDLGIYYDATRPSRIESWLNSDWFRVPEAERQRAARCMDSIRRHRISKYNHATAPLRLGRRTRRRVLVVDQTFGDLSVELGCVPPDGFERMLRAARAEHPDAEILIKTHPDVLAGRKRGFLGAAHRDARTQVIGDVVNPIDMLEQVDHVYVATSQLGFEALMLGKTVTCFGVPFYAGWGLTDDRVKVSRRTHKRDLYEVFAAAYLRYARYVNPATGRRGTLEDLIGHIAGRANPQTERTASIMPQAVGI